MSVDNKPTIPWWRGPSFSFTTVSDSATETASNQRTSFGTTRKSIARTSIRRSSMGRGAMNIPVAEPTAIYTQDAGEVNSCVLSHDGSVGLLGYADGRVGVVRSADGARGDFTQHTNGKAVRQVSLSADGRVGASAALDGTVRVFETDSLIQVALLRQTGFNWANGVALSADGAVLIASFTPRDSDRGKIVHFDWAQRTSTVLWQGFHRVFEVQVSYDASKILFIRQGGVICLLDTTPGQKPSISASFNYMKGDLDASLDAAGARILIADKQLRLHSSRSRGSLLDNFKDYKPSLVRRIDMTADGSRGIEVYKKCILVRNLATGTLILALSHKFRLTRCAIAADGGTVIACDIYGTMVMWRPDLLPKTDLEARYIDGTAPLNLKDLRSVLDGRTSISLLSPLDGKSIEYRGPEATPPTPLLPPPERNDTPPSSTFSSHRHQIPPPPPHASATTPQVPERQFTPLASLAGQVTPPTSPVRTHTPPEQPYSPPTANPRLPLPPAIHPRFLRPEFEMASHTNVPNRIVCQPINLELVSVKGISVSPTSPSPSPGASSESLRNRDFVGARKVNDPRAFTSMETAFPLPDPNQCITNVETSVGLFNEQEGDALDCIRRVKTMEVDIVEEAILLDDDDDDDDEEEEEEEEEEDSIMRVETMKFNPSNDYTLEDSVEVVDDLSFLRLENMMVKPTIESITRDSVKAVDDESILRVETTKVNTTLPDDSEDVDHDESMHLADTMIIHNTGTGDIADFDNDDSIKRVETMNINLSIDSHYDNEFLQRLETMEINRTSTPEGGHEPRIHEAITKINTPSDSTDGGEDDEFLRRMRNMNVRPLTESPPPVDYRRDESMHPADTMIVHNTETGDIADFDNDESIMRVETIKINRIPASEGDHEPRIREEITKINSPIDAGEDDEFLRRMRNMNVRPLTESPPAV